MMNFDLYPTCCQTMHFNHFCVLIKKSWAYCRKCGNFSQTLKSSYLAGYADKITKMYAYFEKR
ncbi:hypothetical protein MHA_0796 [Mannheimia haemolytica PHL213]|nr:hypothetical protein MHA_0796 [Mannheimia haemolytica PHL213]